jgi:hypothetical protein
VGYVGESDEYSDNASYERVDVAHCSLTQRKGAFRERVHPYSRDSLAQSLPPSPVKEDAVSDAGHGKEDTPGDEQQRCMEGTPDPAIKLSCTGSELTVSFNELRCAGPPGG